MGLNGNSGADRSLRVIAVGTGEVIIDVRCAASGLTVTERVLFTVLSRTVDPLTIDKLSALMLAVPVHELQRSSPSPMFLGRSDNLRWNTRNEWLHSRNTREDERRAHWHAGVTAAGTPMAGSLMPQGSRKAPSPRAASLMMVGLLTVRGSRRASLGRGVRVGSGSRASWWVIRAGPGRWSVWARDRFAASIRAGRR